MAESYPDDAVGSDWLFPLQHDAAVTDWSSSHVHWSTARGYRHTDTDTQIYVLAHTHTHTRATDTHRHRHTDILAHTHTHIRNYDIFVSTERVK